MPDVVLVSRYVAQYRVPFHEAVRTELATSGIRYRLLYGAPRPGEAARRDIGRHPLGRRDQLLPTSVPMASWCGCRSWARCAAPIWW